MINVKEVQKACFTYSILPMTFLLKQLGEEERFEECKILKQGIQNQIDKYNLIYTTEYNEENVAAHKAYMLSINGTDGNVSLGNTPIYASMARKYLNI